MELMPPISGIGELTGGACVPLCAVEEPTGVHPNEHDRDADLDGELDPVDALSVTDTKGLCDRSTDHRCGEADHPRRRHRHLLFSWKQKSRKAPDEPADEEREDNRPHPCG